jgi:lysozyme family protein
MHAYSNRRGFLYGGAALTASLAAQDLRGVLGTKIPEPLRAIVPSEALEAVGLVGELLKLEQEAKVLRLPTSKLAFHEGQLQIAPDQLYQQAMPRLVALIDRAEVKAPMLADKAGALLARLHRSEYDPPDAWFAESPQPQPYVATPTGGTLHLGPLPVRPQRIALSPDQVETAEPGIRPELNLPSPDLPPVEAVLPPVATTLKFDALADEYAAWFAAARIRPEFGESADWHLTMMRQSRPRYERVGKRLGIPWYFIAATHGLEASFNFRAHLHNGDFPLTQRTRQIPAGRPNPWLPPSDWESSALDAMRLLGFTGQSDWSLPRCLYRLEAYNGFGYRRAARASPYLWSFSTLYSRGKFVADGKFDPKARSKQCGAAVMLKVLDLSGELD